MKVTEVLKRRGHLCEIRFDDGTYILLDKEYALMKDYVVGKTVSDEQANKDEDESELLRAKNRAIYYLSGADFSVKGLSDKLIKAGFAQGAVEAAVNRMVQLELVNDERFIERFVERCREQNLSKRETVEKLVLKGIARDRAKLAVEDDDGDIDRIVALISKKYANKLENDEAVKKTVASLCRKGFSIYDIKTALKQYIKEELNEL